MQLIHPTHMTHSRGACPSRSRRRALTLATSALLSLAVVGCGSDGPVAPGLGAGSVTASGAVTTSVSGLALFQSVTSGGTSLFQIVIAPVSQSATTWSLQIVNYSGRLAADGELLLHQRWQLANVQLDVRPTGDHQLLVVCGARNLHLHGDGSGRWHELGDRTRLVRRTVRTRNHLPVVVDS